jgi:alanyl-tRNA synthetase
MKGSEIRSGFLRFFEERGHKLVRSASLIPPAESGLLLTNAGMNQFIPYFLGVAEPPFARATSVQKCFRADQDLELVGHDARHLAMFEMLGNFSFGDYFKAESCAWGYELVTEGYGVDPERLWVTVFETDDETVELWADLGIKRERIVRRGKQDNFWTTHVAGPGGPSSEIFVDRGSRYGPDGGPDADEDRFMEIWNHVFMQFEVDDAEEVIADLPKRNIDTGSSVERVAVILQDTATVFETDLLRPIVAVAEELSGKRYGENEKDDVSMRIVAEHGRGSTFLMADGVQPSNEGRGYVLRRILRRLVMHARRLGIEANVMEGLVGATAETLGDAYPEVQENRAYVTELASAEEEQFRSILPRNEALVEETITEVRQAAPQVVGPKPLQVKAKMYAPQVLGAGEKARLVFPGDKAFELHDTRGFPIELTRELADEKGLEVDMGRFEELMDEQRRRAREAAKRGNVDEELGSAVLDTGATRFVGYERLDAETHVAALLRGAERVEVAQEGDEVRFLLPATPFYAESGGQVGDRGLVRTPGGLITVTDAQWAPGEAIVHAGVVSSGEVRVGDEAMAEVDADTRQRTARAHTATHVVHWTLKHLLGEHARQAGSLVAPGRLRFDFPHHTAVSRDLLEQAEEIANGRLAADDDIRIFETTFDEAKELGAVALFGEKYGDVVRVVEVGDYSRELCGGTHVHRTGNVALVRILGESSIGSGMRRVEALVGPDALHEINLEHELLREVVGALGAGDTRAVPERARHLVAQLKLLQSELGAIRKADRETTVASLADTARDVDGTALVVAQVPDEDADGLRELALALRSRLEPRGAAAAVLGNADAKRALLVASCTGALVERGVTAPALLEPAAKRIGGGAGGKPIVAFAGGKEAGALAEALDTVPGRLAELLAGA